MKDMRAFFDESEDPPPLCYGESTRQSDHGHGNTRYFDRHDVKCDGSRLLSRMQLRTHGSNVNFEFTCCAVEGATCHGRSTGESGDGGGNIIFLDRHDIKCNDNEFLSRVKLQTPTGGDIKYDYSCCSVPGKRANCHSRFTNLNDDGGGNSVYLDRHDIRCNAGEFLQRVHLTRGGTHNKVQYGYTCCTSLS